jgi:hypothetical protein
MVRAKRSLTVLMPSHALIDPARSTKTLCKRCGRRFWVTSTFGRTVRTGRWCGSQPWLSFNQSLSAQSQAYVCLLPVFLQHQRSTRDDVERETWRIRDVLDSKDPVVDFAINIAGDRDLAIPTPITRFLGGARLGISVTFFLLASASHHAPCSMSVVTTFLPRLSSLLSAMAISAYINECVYRDWSSA